KALAKSIAKANNRITAQETGLSYKLFAEMEDVVPTFWGRVSSDFLEMSGFSYIDRLGKEVYMNAALDSARSILKKGDKGLNSYKYKELVTKLRRGFGDKGFESLKNELLAWETKRKPSGNLISFAMQELEDAQPIFLSSLPEMYHRMPRGRIVYALKSYMLKQIDLLRRDVYNKLRYAESAEDVTAGIKNAARYFSIVGASGLSVEWLKSNLYGDQDRNPFEGLDEMSGLLVAKQLAKGLGSQSMKLFGMDGYTVDTLLSQGFNAMLAEMITPPDPLLQEALRASGKVVSGNMNSEEALEKFLHDSKRYLPVVGQNWKHGYFPGLGYEDRPPAFSERSFE